MHTTDSVMRSMQIYSPTLNEAIKRISASCHLKQQSRSYTRQDYGNYSTASLREKMRTLSGPTSRSPSSQKGSLSEISRSFWRF
ncbi:hypothetical protein BJY04DRAFT_198642 [Aspergillus karnatakaensis]|uniref:uncharacterized protein n=1 Tax=Aspergillus karnatakaensis TaxID=1810916 RepID=UPI003CCD5D81